MRSAPRLCGLAVRRSGWCLQPGAPLLPIAPAASPSPVTWHLQKTGRSTYLGMYLGSDAAA